MQGHPFFQEAWQEASCALLAADSRQLRPEAICLYFAHDNQVPQMIQEDNYANTLE